MTMQPWGPANLAILVDVREDDDSYGPEYLYTTDTARRFSCGPTQWPHTGIATQSFILSWYHPDAFEYREEDGERAWRCQWCRSTFGWDPR